MCVKKNMDAYNTCNRQRTQKRQTRMDNLEMQTKLDRSKNIKTNKQTKNKKETAYISKRYRKQRGHQEWPIHRQRHHWTINK